MEWLNRTSSVWTAKRLACLFFVFASTASECSWADQDPPSRMVLVVVGAPGELEYEPTFRNCGERWKDIFSQSSQFELIDGTDNVRKDKSDRDRILEWVASKSTAPERWIVLIGHGTSDKDAAKFNLRGPDISAAELSTEIGKQDCRWIIVNCASSSGPFINSLSGKNRVVITATKSGSEQNYARFGEYISQSLADPTTDLDHDNSVSILEAFLAASNRVSQYYANEDRLASEQALLDDNGDAKGTPAAFYRGVRPVKAPADGLQVDGPLASRVIISTFAKAMEWTQEQQSKIESLEIQIEELRRIKKEMKEDDYYGELERLFFEILKVRGMDSIGF
jgi:hypothetical protein